MGTKMEAVEAKGVLEHFQNLQKLLLALKLAWEHAAALFDPRNVNSTIALILPVKQPPKQPSLYLSAMIILLAGILSAFLVLAADVERHYFDAFTFTALKEVTAKTVAAGTEAGSGTLANDLANVQPDFSGMGALVLYLFIFAVPFTLITNYVQEKLAWHLLRLTGGKGAFDIQYHLSSIILLAGSTAAALLLLGPVPLLGFLAYAAYIIVPFYLLFYVKCIAYARVHDLTYLHVLLIIVIVTIPMFIITFILSDAASVFFGIPRIPVNTDSISQLLQGAGTGGA